MTTAATQTTVDFSSISASYTNLKLIYESRDTASGNNASVLRVKVNNDGTAANYSGTGRIGSSGGGAFGTATAASTSGLAIGFSPNDGNTTGMVGGGEITFPSYSKTTFHKRIFSVYEDDDGANVNLPALQGGRWASTAAINQITILTDGTAFKNGLVFTLYGMT